MRRALTQNDIRHIKYQCRAGYVIPFLLFLVASATFFLLYGYYLNFTLSGMNLQIILRTIGGIALACITISYLINRKYYADLKAGEKIPEIKTIDRKEVREDYEAGSGTLYPWQKMKSSESTSIIVDNCRYRVDEELFRKCEEGDQVIFYYAPVSGYLLGIDLREPIRDQHS